MSIGAAALVEAMIYELHIGTITEDGAFRAATAKLDHLVDLDITAIQIMPIADSYDALDHLLAFLPIQRRFHTQTLNINRQS